MIEFIIVSLFIIALVATISFAIWKIFDNDDARIISMFFSMVFIIGLAFFLFGVFLEIVAGIFRYVGL